MAKSGGGGGRGGRGGGGGSAAAQNGVKFAQTVSRSLNARGFNSSQRALNSIDNASTSLLFSALNNLRGSSLRTTGQRQAYNRIRSELRGRGENVSEFQ